MSYGSVRQCPVCGQRAAETGWKKLGPWYVHNRCHADCTLCGEAIAVPPIGKAASVVAWLGKPVHAACKEGVRSEVKLDPTLETDLGTSEDRENEAENVTRPKRGPGGRMAGIRRLEQRRQSGGRFGWGPKS